MRCLLDKIVARYALQDSIYSHDSCSRKTIWPGGVTRSPKNFLIPTSGDAAVEDDGSRSWLRIKPVLFQILRRQTAQTYPYFAMLRMPDSRQAFSQNAA